MLVWNDLEPAEKIKVYDKGVDVGTEQGVYDLLVSYRSGDMWAPRVEDGEALHRETRYFLDCVASGARPINDGHAGLRVVRMLEAADDSLRRRRETVYAGARIDRLLPRRDAAPLQGVAGGVPVTSAAR
jgi:predicted dehydrogenase